MLFVFESMLDSLITSKTRLRLLVKFFLNAANEGYLRGLAEELDENTNAIRKELNHLSDAGLIDRNEVGTKITYRANNKHPFFTILHQLVRKYVGLDAIIETIVGKAGDIEKVYLLGDYARGVDSGHIEVLVQGNELNETYLQQLSTKVANLIQKRVSVYTGGERKDELVLIYENRK